MGTHIFNTLEELDNVTQTITPPWAGGDPLTKPTLLAEQLPNGTWQLTTADELDPSVDAIDSSRTPTEVLLREANKQRDLALDAGLTFEGKIYQTRSKDRENIAGGGQAATLAITLEGVQPGNLRWHKGTDDFAWIAEDNSTVPMDAQTMVRFAQSAGSRQSRIIRSTRHVKDMIEAGQITRIDQIPPAIEEGIPESEIFPTVQLAPTTQVAPARATSVKKKKSSM